MKQKSCFIIFHKYLDKYTTMSYMSVYAKCSLVKKGNALGPERLSSLWLVLILNLWQDLLQTVFEDGVLVKEYTFAEVRENAEIPLVKASKQNGLK